MDFDSYTVVLLSRGPDAPQLDEAASAALQDAHLAYLAGLHEAGHLVAAGPLMGGPDQPLRGMTVLRVPPDRARELSQQDPAVRAGRFALTVLPWMVPTGAMTFMPTRFPRSMAEVEGD